MSQIEAALREPWERLDEQASAARFGMWVFLASEILFFGAFFMAYAYLRTLHPDAFRLASSQTGIGYGTANTIILLTSSLTMGLATRAASSDLRRLAVGLLLATVALGCAFLVVKGFEYHDDLDKHLWPGRDFPIPVASAQLFFAGYWFITVVHVIHLAIGIGVTARLAYALDRQGLPLVSPQVDMIALYWSFVDVVWVLLFPVVYLGGRS